MCFYKKHQKIRGFTLIELLVVISIISLLASLAVAALRNARAKARDSRRLSDIRQIATALNLYYDDNDAYPIGLRRCLGIADAGSCWSGTCGVNGSTSLINDLSPYLVNIPLDPSDRTVNAYIYGRGGFSPGCGGPVENAVWIMWQPDSGPVPNDSVCLDMGIHGCCGAAGPCGCADGHVCGYKVADL